MAAEQNSTSEQGSTPTSDASAPELSGADSELSGAGSERIFLFGQAAAGEKSALIRTVANEMGVAVELIAGSDLELTVQELLDRPTGQGPANTTSSEPESQAAAGLPQDATEFMLVDGFTDQRLDQLLGGLRSANASVGLKAGVTPTNLGWTVSKLIGESVQENLVMQAFMSLFRVYRQAEETLKSHNSKDSLDEILGRGGALADAFVAAGDLMRSEEEHTAQEYERAESDLRAALDMAESGDVER